MVDSFVYCWQDKLTNKMYIGSHKGNENDGYICSSKKGLKHKSFYGRPMKIETKEKIIQANLGKKMSKETREKMSAARKAFIKRKKGALNG